MGGPQLPLSADYATVCSGLGTTLDDVPGSGVAPHGPRAFERAELVSRSALQAD